MTVLAGLGLSTAMNEESDTNLEKRATCPDATPPQDCTSACKVNYDACVKGVRVVVAKMKYRKGDANYCRLKRICAKGGHYMGGDIIEA